MNSNTYQHFGSHPEFPKGLLSEIWQYKRTVPLDSFYDPSHPEIFLIPRNNFFEVLDYFDDSIGIERISFPFSSFDFFIDFERNEKGVFHSLTKNPTFRRMGGISQLGYLFPKDDRIDHKHQKVFYLPPAFPHTRWLHSLTTAILAELILTRNDFSFNARAPFVLAAGSHDIATPAGGDSTMRIEKDLSEEKNYSQVLTMNGLHKKWEKRFNFNLGEAQSWVNGKGVLGHLLDIVDKISYTCLDCYFLGLEKSNLVRTFCDENPLVMDIWQDIVYDHEYGFFYFKNPERLYNFLHLRALEHLELLFEPRSRALDFYIGKYVKKLYQKGTITKMDLLTKNDSWLNLIFEEEFPNEFNCIISPDELIWKKFQTKEELEKFSLEIDSEKIDHVDHIKGFKLGIDWLVNYKGRITRLKDCISKKKLQALLDIVELTKGWCLYYKK